jgi:beta-mannosidase
MVYIVSDKTVSTPPSLRVRLMDFDGKVLIDEKHDVSIDPLASKVYLQWPLAKLTQAGAADTSRVFVIAELSASGTPLSRNLVYIAPTKEVHLKPANLTIASTGANGNYRIRITSPVLARDVYLSFGAIDAKLSDNYFDILPGETVEVTATSNATLDELKAQLKVISLIDAFAAPNQPASISAAH